MTTQTEAPNMKMEDAHDATDINPGTLAISGLEPAVVHIHMKSYQGKVAPVFSSDQNKKQYYAGGVSWAGGGSATSMFVTFRFGAGVLNVDCDDQQYSPVYDANNNHQMLCIAPTDGTYDFFVNTPQGRHIDPKIIVTPLPLPDPTS